MRYENNTTTDKLFVDIKLQDMHIIFYKQTLYFLQVWGGGRNDILYIAISVLVSETQRALDIKTTLFVYCYAVKMVKKLCISEKKIKTNFS